MRAPSVCDGPCCAQAATAALLDAQRDDIASLAQVTACVVAVACMIGACSWVRRAGRRRECFCGASDGAVWRVRHGAGVR